MSDSALPALPKVRPIYDVMYLEGRIRMGSGPAYASEIEDPDGRWATLVRLLDGSRSIARLQRELDGRLSADEVIEGVGTLHEAGFLEDGGTTPPQELTADDLRRYAPNLNFFRTRASASEDFHAPQVVLKNTRVLVLGMGGIGTNVCMALAELGIGSITGLDFDRVELSNLNRQVLYSTPAVGRPKVDVAAERMARFNPDIEFDAVERRLTSLSDVEAVIDAAAPDFVFCLADKPNGWIDFWVNEACVKRRIPYTAGSISAHLGTAYSVVPGQGPCYRCIVDGETAEHAEFAEILEYVRIHDLDSSNGALGPACMFLGYFLSYELLRERLGLGPVLASGKLLEIDFVTFQQQWHTTVRRPDCPVCTTAVPATPAPPEPLDEHRG
ncbi:ThiF family adenylyltransferase [Kitasatospora sp. NPDC059577]|uniref:ThiF family adenylyltransferase n=1 Tax=unclassified Kitasatospora TaxID=2633591 RepID=UPI00368D839D